MHIIFAFPGYETFASRVQALTGYEFGDVVVKKFPDGDSLVTIHSNVKDKAVILVCGLDNADAKVMPLMFFASTAMELGAKSVRLVAPYLGYMRQDKRFFAGEAITSKIFATFISSIVDSMITLDPHLHRYKLLDEIYTIPTTVLHASTVMGLWVKENVKKPLLIGPDEESQQWVSEIAMKAEAPFVVLQKKRYGDRDVEISVPEIAEFLDYTPVLVDDIISTARTMIEAVGHLLKTGMTAPVCLGIHAIFADDAYNALKEAGVEKIVTTNTILHETNGIDVTTLFADFLKGIMTSKL